MRTRTWLLIVGVVGLASAAIVHGALRGPDSPDDRPLALERLRGANVPTEGALRGRLYFAAVPACSISTLDFADLSLSGGALRRGCSLWVSPTRRAAVLARRARGEDGSREIWLAALDGDARVARSLGLARGEVSWSPDGDRVAWCRDDGHTAVLDTASGAIVRVDGCAPRFTPTGSLLTLSDEPGDTQLLVDGKALVEEAELAAALPAQPSGPLHPIGVDQRSDGLLAVVISTGPRALGEILAEIGIDLSDREAAERASRELGLIGPNSAVAVSAGGGIPRQTLQLWRGNELEAAVPLRSLAYPFANRRFGELVRFSPSGNELAIGFHGVGVPVMLLDVQSLRASLRPTIQHGFDWSPDGAWFALSTGRDVAVYGALRGDPAYVLPVRAAALAWRGPWDDRDPARSLDVR